MSEPTHPSDYPPESPPEYLAARRYLEQYVPGPGQFTPPDAALARTVALMDALDNPQEARPVIHLAGTSGKGSTATILAALLQAHGLHTGLGLSPHIRTLTERIQLDGAPIDPILFAAAVDAMRPAVDAIAAGEHGAPSFFEITIALSYLVFAGRVPGYARGCAPVDVVVMETGLGGRTDATNVVRSADKIALFTPIDLDHTDLLGDSVTQIAREKAGIIRPGNTVISVRQQDAVQSVLAEVCQARGASLTWFDVAAHVQHIQPGPTHVEFDFAWPDQTGMGEPLSHEPLWRDLTLSLGGAHQAANAGPALFAARHFLATQDHPLDEQAVRTALQTIEMPGRMDLQQVQGQPVLLDGAHNPQKMQALITALEAAYPDTRFCFIVALKRGKDLEAVLRRLLPHAAHLVVTRFENNDQGMLVKATDPSTIAAQLDALGFADFETTTHMDDALRRALRWAASHTSASDVSAGDIPIIVTGSLYLLAEAYAAIEAATDSASQAP